MSGRMICVLLLFCLLPVCSMAVTEGVVEEAPPVALDLLDSGYALFGSWEQGLTDIESAARSILERRFGCPQDMVLYSIQVGNHTLAQGSGAQSFQGERMTTYLYVIFRFTDERMGGSMSAQVGFDFETGRLNNCAIGRWYEDEHELVELEYADTPLDMTKEEQIQLVDGYLRDVLGMRDYDILNAANIVFADGSRMSAFIGRHTKTVISLRLSRFAQEVTVK